MLDPSARRLIVASAVRLHVAQRLGTGPLAADLDAGAAALPGTEELTRRYGLGFDPPYPGVSAGVEMVRGVDRLVLACRATRDGEPAAVVVTTLVAGRPPQVTAAPPETPVPAGWTPFRGSDVASLPRDGSDSTSPDGSVSTSTASHDHQPPSR